MRKIDFILDFYKSWERHDIEAIVAGFTPDGVYHNVPMEPVVGQDAIRAWLINFFSGVEHSSLKHLLGAETGDVAFSEHFDSFEMKDGKTLALALVGVFEFREGRIAKWRDYFDGEAMSRQMPGWAQVTSTTLAEM